METTLEWILTTDIINLQNKELLADFIGKAGLTGDDRKSPENNSMSIYGDDVKYKLSTMKEGLWQTPLQLAGFLICLSTKNIKSFLEIGTFTGYTTIIIGSYLFRYSLKILDTIDVNHFINYDILQLITKFNVPINYKIIRSREEITKKYDFIFIDADHSYEGVSCDYIYFKNYTHMIGFHDINDWYCTGVVRLWNELCNFKEKYEFTEHPNNFKLMGIGFILF